MSLFKSGNYVAGQAIDPVDLNNLTKWLRSQFFDTLAGLAQSRPEDTASNGNHLFAFGAAGGAPSPGAGLTLNSAGGIIAQQFNAPDGNDPAFYSYLLASNELQTTLGAADPTNPRIDLICVSLGTYNVDTPITRDFMSPSGVLSSQTFQSSRSTGLVKQVIAGIAAPTPVIPSVPIGMVPWAAVLIPATTTTIDPANVYDYRIPVGNAGYLNVLGKEFSFSGASAAIDRGVVGHGVSGISDYFGLKFPGKPNQRILSIDLASEGAQVVDIRSSDILGFTLTVTSPLRDLTATLAGAGPAIRTYTPAAAPSTLEPPLWGNGMTNWFALRATSPGSGFGWLRISYIGATASTMYGARFKVAG